MCNVILWGDSAVTIVWAVMTYNGLVNLKHNVSKAFANIDVLLKQRHDELPKLVEVCKQYAQFEQSTLENVMQARSAVFTASQSRNIEALGNAESQLRSAARPDQRRRRSVSGIESQRKFPTSARPNNRIGKHHRRPARILQ